MRTSFLEEAAEKSLADGGQLQPADAEAGGPLPDTMEDALLRERQQLQRATIRAAIAHDDSACACNAGCCVT